MEGKTQVIIKHSINKDLIGKRGYIEGYIDGPGIYITAIVVIEQSIHKLMTKDLRVISMSELIEYREAVHFRKTGQDILNWAKSELAEVIQPKLDKVKTPYHEEKIGFLNTIIKKLGTLEK